MTVDTGLGQVNTILEDCFLAVDAVMGRVNTKLKDCFSAVDAVLGRVVDSVLETYAINLDGLRTPLAHDNALHLTIFVTLDTNNVDNYLATLDAD